MKHAILFALLSGLIAESAQPSEASSMVMPLQPRCKAPLILIPPLQRMMSMSLPGAPLDLSVRPAQLPLRKRLSDAERTAQRLLLNAVRYGVRRLAKLQRTDGMFILPNHREHGVRPFTSLSWAFAVALRCCNVDAKVVGLTSDELQRLTVQLIHSIAMQHLTGTRDTADGKRWGYHWQSALWAASLGGAAWLLWDELPSNLREQVTKLLLSECERFANYVPPYREFGDTKAEENAWNALIPALVVNMFPQLKQRDLYHQKAVELLVTAYATAADARSDVIVDGKPLRQWVRGPNIHDDFTLENHGFVHPDYMCCIALKYVAGLFYKLGGQPIPESVLHNAEHVFANLAFLWYPDGSWIYPQGTDWSIRRYPIVYHIGVLHSLLTANAGEPHTSGSHLKAAEDDALTRIAATIADSASKTLTRMQARHADGRTFATGEFTTYPGAEEMAARIYADVVLAHRLFGKRLRPLPMDVALERLQGSKIFRAGHIAAMRTARSFASFAWQPILMGFCTPLLRDKIIAPTRFSYIGRLERRGQRAKLLKCEVTESKDVLAVCGILARANGAIEQRIGFVMLRDGRVLLVERLIARRGDVSATLHTGTVSVLNPANWVFHDGKRKLSWDSGEKLIHAGSKESANLGDKGTWLVADNRIGWCKLGGGKAGFQSRGDLIELWFNQIDVHSKGSGAVLSEFILLTCPNADIRFIQREARALKRLPAPDEVFIIQVRNRIIAVNLSDVTANVEIGRGGMELLPLKVSTIR